MKIRYKLLWAMLLSVIPVELISLALLNELRNVYSSSAELKILHDAHELKNEQAVLAAEIRELLIVLARDEYISTNNHERLSVVFKGIVDASPIYSNIFYCNTEGDILASAVKLSGNTNSFGRKYFQDAMNTRGFSAGEYVVGRVTQNKVFHFSYPVMEGNGIVKGVLVLSVKLDHYIERLEKNNLPPGSFVRLFDHDGVSLLRIPEDNTHYPVGARLSPDFWDTISRKWEGTLLATGSDGIRKFYAYTSVSLADTSNPYMYFLMGIPEEYVYSKHNRLLMVLGVSVLGCCLISFLLFRNYSDRMIIHRIAALSKSMNADETCEIGTEGKDEISNLIQKYNLMKSRIDDTTEKLVRARDQADMASRSKSEFIANMSHEIRTPFNGIMGMLQLCQETELTEEQANYVYTALASSRKLLVLVNDVLDLARIEQGGESVNFVAFNLRVLAGELLQLFETQARERQISLSLDMPRDFHEWYFGDETKIRQVLFNILGNSIKATEKGRVGIDVVALGGDSARAANMLVTVYDTGLGIPDHAFSRLFKPFSQVDGSYTRKRQGAGLGLSIVKRLVELMDGSVCMCSEAGVGTATYLSLRLEQHEAVGEATGEAPDAVESRQLRILLAEDERINQVTTKAFLAKSGWRVDLACDGEEALALFRKETYDIIITDIHMPGMDGLQLIGAVRGLGGEALRVPIIALTALAMQGDREDILKRGASLYLSKPVDLRELKSSILALVRARG